MIWSNGSLFKLSFQKEIMWKTSILLNLGCYIHWSLWCGDYKTNIDYGVDFERHYSFVFGDVCHAIKIYQTWCFYDMSCLIILFIVDLGMS